MSDNLKLHTNLSRCLDASSGSTTALCTDGTVLTFGKAARYDEYRSLRKMKSIVVSNGKVLGLEYESSFVDIVAATVYPELRKGMSSSGQNFIFRLDSKGRVSWDGKNVSPELHSRVNNQIKNWVDIVELVAVNGKWLGLKSDGSVVASDHIKLSSQWSDVIAIDVGEGYVVGVKKSGMLIIDKRREDVAPIDTRCFKDIVRVAAGWNYVAGLTSDGRVQVVDHEKEMDTSHWDNVIAISGSDSHLVGLKSDGTLLATGYNGSGQCDVGDAKNVGLVNVKLMTDREKQDRKERLVCSLEWKKKGLCPVCGSNMKGMIRKKCESFATYATIPELKGRSTHPNHHDPLWKDFR